ncbi:GNAT family N-acetyltransferase [Psychrobacillus antarcticus]|uniref:GNAT family N-acetyltransferase n=1 Tax=Psychrobacillus antarcticus TaxID=2879115 RepID=UPI002407A348|nr:GNAT family N-acetyltransferase [Psychrobacillus antarcticus]
MDIFIEKLLVTDAEDLYNFELGNRTFFEEMVPTRGDGYYNPETFKKRHETLLEEQVIGGSCFYLIKDHNSSIVGRINLVDMDESDKIGYLGYRVGQAHTGKGIAKKALKLLVETVTDEGVKQIKAKTTTNNIASQRVLEKNGFERIGTSREEFEMNGRRLKFVYYALNISS